MSELENKELDRVNGGCAPVSNFILCPKCNKEFDCSENVITHGSGCDSKVYWKCPYCGYEWDE